MSPTTHDRDLHIKRKLYERFGVPEYWVVDPETSSLTVYRRTPQGYGLRARYERMDFLECPEFPGLEVSLERVFRA